MPPADGIGPRGWLLALVALVGSSACGASPEPTHATLATYYRGDTDGLEVVSPSARGGFAVGDTAVDFAYGADVWSGASIDIRTAATPHVEEVRHEAQLGVAHDASDLRWSARYRLSVEPDYVSNALTLHGEVELWEGSSTLAVDLSGGGDDVGRSGDPRVHRPAGRLSGRVQWTQLFDPETVASLSGEVVGVMGYQASPYRFVALGGDGTCAGGAPACVPERLPTERLRAALSVRLRRALGAHLSVGAGYRLYGDSFGIVSHTADVELSLAPDRDWLFTYGYRFYAQGEAWFYAPRYFDLDAPFPTRDRKLSALRSHEVTAELAHRLALGRDAGLRVALRGSGTLYEYAAFVGLTDVYAVELTLVLGADFE